MKTKVGVMLIASLSVSTMFYKASYDQEVVRHTNTKGLLTTASQELESCSTSLMECHLDAKRLDGEVSKLNKAVDNSIGVYLSSVGELNKSKINYIRPVTGCTDKGGGDEGGIDMLLDDNVTRLLDKTYNDLYNNTSALDGR